MIFSARRTVWRRLERTLDGSPSSPRSFTGIETTSKVYALLFAAYLGSGPVYWIPFVDVRIVGAVKTALFLVVAVYPFFFKISFSNFFFPGGRKTFYLFVLFLLLSIPGMLYGDRDAAVYRLQNTFQILTIVYASGFLIKKKLIGIVLRESVKIFALLALASFVLMLLIPDYPNPINTQLTLAETGLGGSRTGWGPSVAMYLPWLYVGYVFSGIGAWIGVFAMSANAVLIAGRTGMVAAVVPFVVWAFAEKGFRSFLIVASVTTIAAIYASENLEILRLSPGSLATVRDLDEFSTGRIETYLIAFYAILENPLVGYGVGELQYAGQSWYIHNVILRLAAEGGILYALTAVGMFWIVLRRGWQGVKHGSPLILAAFLSVLSGIVTSIFEPGAMFGPFHMAAFWWVCFSACVTSAKNATFDDGGLTLQSR